MNCQKLKVRREDKGLLLKEKYSKGSCIQWWRKKRKEKKGEILSERYRNNKKDCDKQMRDNSRKIVCIIFIIKVRIVS